MENHLSFQGCSCRLIYKKYWMKRHVSRISCLFYFSSTVTFHQSYEWSLFRSDSEDIKWNTKIHSQPPQVLISFYIHFAVKYCGWLKCGWYGETLGYFASNLMLYLSLLHNIMPFLVKSFQWTSRVFWCFISYHVFIFHLLQLHVNEFVIRFLWR